MVYYIGYIFHNPEAIKALREIEKGLWIDWPPDDRMELREAEDAAILMIESCVYSVTVHSQAHAGPPAKLHSFAVDKVFHVRVERDTAALISAIDKLNESKDPALHLKSDPRDGIKLFIES